MKKLLFLALGFLMMTPLANIGCQSSANGDIEVSEPVIRTGEAFGKDYIAMLNRAKTGDNISIKEFIEFHKYVDGIEGINHGQTCLELIPVVGDDKFGGICHIIKPTLKKVLLERLVLAQPRTKKTELQKPMSEWAPITWAALNGQAPSQTLEKFDPTKPNFDRPGAGSTLSPDKKEEMNEKMKMQEPAAEPAPDQQPQPAAAPETKPRKKNKRDE